MRVLVTGAAGCLAAALLPRLVAAPGVVAVTGLDIRPCPYVHPGFRFLRVDLRDPAVPDLLREHDALVHLAFVVLRGRMPARTMHAVNVEAGAALFRAARRAGLRRLVHLSSASVYGSGSALAEDAPMRPLPGFLYGEHKAALEARLAEECPEAVRLRPHAILGPHAQPLLRFLVRQPCCIATPGAEPALQCVHEEDVVQAVLSALAGEHAGPFNLAAPDPFTFREAILLHRRHALAVPLAVARLALRAAWTAFGAGGEPGWIDGLASPLTLDCSRAQRLLGWQARIGAREALRA